MHFTFKCQTVNQTCSFNLLCSCFVNTVNLVAILFLSSFLGYVDKLGVAYEAPTVATGFGAYLAQVSLTC